MTRRRSLARLLRRLRRPSLTRLTVASLTLHLAGLTLAAWLAGGPWTPPPPPTPLIVELPPAEAGRPLVRPEPPPPAPARPAPPAVARRATPPSPPARPAPEPSPPAPPAVQVPAPPAPAAAPPPPPAPPAVARAPEPPPVPAPAAPATPVPPAAPPAVARAPEPPPVPAPAAPATPVPPAPPAAAAPPAPAPAPAAPAPPAPAASPAPPEPGPSAPPAVARAAPEREPPALPEGRPAIPPALAPGGSDSPLSGRGFSLLRPRLDVPPLPRLPGGGGSRSEGEGAGESGREKEGQVAAIPLNKPPDPDHAEYFLKIKRAIEDNWSYPRAAAEKGQSGQLVLEFTIRRDGNVLVELVRSSGVDILDRYAITAIKLSAPFPPIPDRLTDSMRISASFTYILDHGFRVFGLR